MPFLSSKRSGKAEVGFGTIKIRSLIHIGNELVKIQTLSPSIKR